jgi:branched-chain amino acid transport system permease protein
MGIDITLIGFVAIFFGGTDSVKGAAIAGTILGLVRAYSSLFVTDNFTYVILFGLLYIVLIIKPSGIFGSGNASGVLKARKS